VSRGRASVISLAVFLFVLGARLHGQVLIEVGEEWRYLKGTVAAPVDWRLVNFDDSTWESGPTGIGYADGDDTTMLTDMVNTYGSFYARKRFATPNPASVTRLTLNIDYDDGFIAYLNGVEVARSTNMGAPGTEQPNTFFANPDHEAGTAEDFVIDLAAVDLAATNVLAIQLHNATINSSDASLIPRLLANPLVCPQGLTCAYDATSGAVTLTWTQAGSSQGATVRRNGTQVASLPGTAVTYVDNTPGTGEVTYEVRATSDGQACEPVTCTVIIRDTDEVVIDIGEDWRFFRGTVDPPAQWNTLNFDDSTWELGATGIGYGDNDDATILSDMMGVYASVFTRKRFTLPAGTSRLFVEITVDDGFVAYLNGAEVHRYNMPVGAVTAATLAAVAGEPILETFIVPSGMFQTGNNVLAVSVHNGGSLASSDLSFIPQVFRSGGGPVGLNFRRGDLTNDATLNLADALNLLNYLFQNGPRPACLDTADVDDNGSANLADALVLLNFLFQNGPTPPPPGLNCGPDPTNDAFGTCMSAGC
jgi:hypothetical protein